MIPVEGHGGKEKGVFDPGAVANDLRECDLTIDICRRIKDRLDAYAVDCRIGPQGSLFDRVKLANELQADFFLSVHVNAGGGTGFESYVHTNAPGKTRELQIVIHSASMSFLRKHNIFDRGRKQADFYVLRETKMPAVLLECLFIDRKDDAAKLQDEAFRDGLSNEIAWGLVNAFGLGKKEPAQEAEQQYCPNCAKLYEENQRLRQVLKQLASIAAPYMIG